MRAMCIRKAPEVLPLAPKALVSLHPYDQDYEVLVHLDDPLWVPRQGPKDVAMEIMSLCEQLDTLILSRSHERKLAEEKQQMADRKVTFEKLFASKAAAILKLMEEHLIKAGFKTSLVDYFIDTGLSLLFPRVELYLQEPDQLLEQVPSPMSGYISHLTSLNNIMTMARQLHSDVLGSSSHKYIAHEMALLYQCLTPVSHFMPVRKEIEERFTAIKDCCVSSPSGHPPKLTPELKAWVLDRTRNLIDTISSLPHELFYSDLHIQQVLNIIHDIPSS